VKKGQEAVRDLKGLCLFHQNFPRRFEPLHSHSEHQFFVPLESSIEILDGVGKRYEVQRGQVAFLWSGFEHSFRSKDAPSAELLLGLIGLNEWKKAAPSLARQAQKPQLEVFRLSQFLKELLLYLLTTTHSQLLGPLVPCALLNIADGLEGARVLDLKALGISASGVLDPALKQAVKLIDDRFFEDLDLAQISMTVGVHQRTLQRRFEKELGLGPKRYLSMVRVEESKKLLQESSMSITQIAYEVGFGSFSRYVDAFRSFTGTLPSDYRSNSLLG
jgi:AraC-like DNA-binding protein